MDLARWSTRHPGVNRRGRPRVPTWTTSGQAVEAAVLSAEPTAWNRDVLYLGGQAVAEIDAAGVHELHADHLGSPLLVTKGSGSDKGTIEGRQIFGPYGEKLPPGRPAGLSDAQWAAQNTYQPLTGYTGHVTQDPTSLIYMRGRFYSPAWHRFLNSDQGVDPNSWNQMAYVGGSPFMAVDPSGMKISVTIKCGDKIIGTFTFNDLEEAKKAAHNACHGGYGSATVGVTDTGGSVDGNPFDWSTNWNPSGIAIHSGGGGGGGGNGPPTKPSDIDCAWIKKMIALEQKGGTAYASNTGNAPPPTMNPNTSNGFPAFPTSVGLMDVAWFYELSKIPISSRNIPSYGAGLSLSIYSFAKNIHNIVSGLAKYGGDPYAANHKWEIPFLPPREASAAFAAAQGLSYSSIFNENWIRKNCK